MTGVFFYLALIGRTHMYLAIKEHAHLGLYSNE